MAAVLLAVASVVVLMGSTQPAGAHTDLIASAPRADETVGLATERVVLTFGLDLTPGSGQVVVRDPRGVDTVTGAPSMSGSTLEVPVRLGSPGRHEVAYRALASDGHVVVGELVFDVAAPGVGAEGPGELVPALPSASSPAAGSGGERFLVTLLWGLGVALMALLVLLHNRRGRGSATHPRS